MILRWLIPATLLFLLWACVAGVWLHDWRLIAGSIVAFVGVCMVDEVEA